VLDIFKHTLGVDVCYLMDRHGVTIASSNRNASDSFVGQNFSFRPYFREARQGVTATYMAVGTTSHKRGAYYSHPIFARDYETPIGVVIIPGSSGADRRPGIRTGADHVPPDR